MSRTLQGKRISGQGHSILRQEVQYILLTASPTTQSAARDLVKAEGPGGRRNAFHADVSV
jgi:hypothetical protein